MKEITKISIDQIVFLPFKKRFDSAHQSESE